MVLAHEAAPPGRVAEVVGLRVGMMYGMQSVAPLAMGAIGAANGLGAVFWIMGGLLALQCYAERRQWRKSASLGDS
jgi:hypothetical protein